MRIISLNIQNFGPIESVSFQAGSSSNVLGLTGINGAGKSHVFRALRFALTGGLSDDNDTAAADTFIRDGAKSATVELKFVKGPHTVTVSRTITPSVNKRNLTVEGPEACKDVTADKAVKAKLSDVLGVDLDVVDKCVFIPQGSFTKILYGTWSERELLLASVLGAPDFSAVKKTATKMAENMIRDTRDIQPLIDSLNANIIELNRAIVEHDANYLLTSTSMVDVVLKQYSEYEQILANYDGAVAEYTRCDNALKQSSAPGEIQSTQAAEKYRVQDQATKDALGLYRQQESDADAAQRMAMQLEASLAAKRRIEQTNATIHQLYSSMGAGYVLGESGEMLTVNRGQELHAPFVDTHVFRNAIDYNASLSRALSDIQPRLMSIIKDSELKETVVRDLLSYEKSMTSLTEQLRVFTEERDAFHADKMMAGVYNSATGTLQLIERLKKASSDKCVTESCPVCSQPIANLSEILKTEPALRELVKDYTNRSERHERDVQVATKEVYDLITPIDYSKRRIAEIDARLGNDNAPDAKLSLARCNANLDLLTIERNQLLQMESTRVALVNPTHVAMSQAAEVANVSVEDLTKRVADVKEQHANLRVLLQSTAAKINGLKTDTQNAWNEYQTMLQVNAVHSRLLGEFTASHDRLGVCSGAAKDIHVKREEVAPRIAELQAARDEIIRNVATRKGLATRRDEVEKQLIEAHEEQRKGASVKRACDFLSVAATLFDKKGLQAEFLKQRFTAILAFVNDALSLMRAGFSVRISPEVALSFDCTFDSGVTWRAMTKLSGGQRVRLTVAFMMAVQATILRSVGLLILDEPTTHVDEAGVESIVDLFQSVYGYLAANDMTVFICDHAPEMHRAFQETLHITKSQ